MIGSGLFERATAQAPSGQFLRYLAVGAWNTLFGYGLYAALTYLFSEKLPYGYVIAIACSNVIAVSVAYFGYKFFVFKTKGNYIREYFRCFAVYGLSILANIAILPVLVGVVGPLLANKKQAPYVAGALLTAGTTVVSFIGHKRISFRG